jgi:multidrug resistance efflux pump
MTSGVGDLVRAPGYRPVLRSDIRFSQAQQMGIVIIHDPLHDRRFELYESECLIAKEMNGARDLDALTQVARRHIPWATRAHVEKLAIQIADMGLLCNVPSALFARSSSQAPVPVAEPSEAPNDRLDGLDDWTELSDPSAEVADLSPSQLSPTVSRPPDPIAFAANHDTVAEVTESAVTTSETTAPSVEAPTAAVECASPSSTVDAKGLQREPLPPVDVPAWEVERPSFFARNRRLVYLGIFALVIAALAIIPYPLYITEPCVVIPVERAQVRSEVEGIISKVLVREDQVIEAGAPIVRLDDREMKYALAQATADVERLTAALAKVKSGNRPEEIRRSRALVEARAQDLRFAKIEAARKKKLFDQGVASATQRDEAHRDLEVKRSAYMEAEAELKLVQSGSRNEEVVIAQAELRRAEADVAFLEQKLELLTIRAPIAGRVLTPKIHESVGARVGLGDEICEIGSPQHMLVEVFVDEAEADALAIGQPVAVKVRSYPLEEFSGNIELIAPAVRVEEGRRILRVEAKLDNSSGLLRPRMTGYAEIDAGSRTVLGRLLRRGLRWIRVRFLI